MSTAPGLTALRYLTRFECQGAECIDTCCAGWRVLVDEPHYAQLEAKLAPLGAAAFGERVVLLPAAQRKRSAHAALAMIDPGERCTFLDAQRLCSLQREHGESSLPDVCAEYPRNVMRVGARAELTGAASCPEIARLLLFARDATDLVEADATLLRRVQPGAIDGHGPGEARIFDALRGAFHELAATPGFPLRSRLFMLGAASLRMAPLFGAKRLDARALSAQLAELALPEAHAMLDEAARRECSPTGGALETVVRALALRGQAPQQPHYAALMRALLPHLVAVSGGAVSVSSGGYDLDPNRLLPVFMARSAALHARFEEVLDVAQTNLARHSIISAAPTFTLASFPLFAAGLVLRAAMQQLLLVFHPEADAVCASGSEARLRGLLQQGVYVLARGLEHNEELSRGFHAVVRERVTTLPDLAALCALC